jgi:hypothetical protein
MARHCPEFALCLRRNESARSKHRTHVPSSNDFAGWMVAWSSIRERAKATQTPPSAHRSQTYRYSTKGLRPH